VRSEQDSRSAKSQHDPCSFRARYASRLRSSDARCSRRIRRDAPRKAITLAFGRSAHHAASFPVTARSTREAFRSRRASASSFAAWLYFEKRPCRQRGERQWRRDFPPCIRQRPFGMAAVLQCPPERVRAPQAFIGYWPLYRVSDFRTSAGLFLVWK
jgi:hypothetical protein